jgi:hypothetical protein
MHLFGPRRHSEQAGEDNRAKKPAYDRSHEIFLICINISFSSRSSHRDLVIADVRKTNPRPRAE